MKRASTGPRLPSRSAITQRHLPLERALLRFFEERQACTIAFAAHVTGLSVREIGRLIARGEMSFDAGRIPWNDVALAFESAWPAEIKQSLLRGINGYPALLRTSPVLWWLPRYLLVALELEAARASADSGPWRRSVSVDEYASDQLHSGIDIATVSDLRGSREFREAYFFPEKPE